jgi:cbb3-type cytochrome oxidase subunit 3
MTSVSDDHFCFKKVTVYVFICLLAYFMYLYEKKKLETSTQTSDALIATVLSQVVSAAVAIES